jgi:cysteine-rich repeat protein
MDVLTGGGTGWLTATAPVVPGETIELDLMIFDVTDNITDSLVLIDGFEWRAAECGDGNVDAGEQCDDGNNISGDGCSATCTLWSENCEGDFEPDGDVDGSDLVQEINAGGLNINQFAADFGRTDCPEI